MQRSLPQKLLSALGSLSVTVHLGTTLRAQFHSSNALCTSSFLLSRVSPTLSLVWALLVILQFSAEHYIDQAFPPQGLMANSLSLFLVQWSFHCVTVLLVEVGWSYVYLVHCYVFRTWHPVGASKSLWNGQRWMDGNTPKSDPRQLLIPSVYPWFLGEKGCRVFAQPLPLLGCSFKLRPFWSWGGKRSAGWLYFRTTPNCCYSRLIREISKRESSLNESVIQQVSPTQSGTLPPAGI